MLLDKSATQSFTLIDNTNISTLCSPSSIVLTGPGTTSAYASTLSWANRNGLSLEINISPSTDANLNARAGIYSVVWTRGQTSTNFNLYLCKIQAPSTVVTDIYIDLDEGNAVVVEPFSQ